jgi:hypothetical protein
MEIPESIEKLTVITNSADPFINNTYESPSDVDKIIDVVRRNINTADYAAVEEGKAFYKKETQSDRNVIKNFLQLYCDTLTKTLQTSNVNDDLKPVLQKSINDNIKGIMHNIDAIGNILDFLNKQKNILDVKRISFIMLGYAIGIIKKISHN